MEAESLLELIKSGRPGVVFHLIDLRTPDAYAGLHVPGAQNVPYALLAEDRSLFVDGRPVVFYDDGPVDLAHLNKSLRRRLPRNVVVLDGGFRGWLAAQLPIEQGAP